MNIRNTIWAAAGLTLAIMAAPAQAHIQAECAEDVRSFVYDVKATDLAQKYLLDLSTTINDFLKTDPTYFGSPPYYMALGQHDDAQAELGLKRIFERAAAIHAFACIDKSSMNELYPEDGVRPESK